MADIEFRVATEFNVVKVRVTKEGEQRVDSLTKKHCCLGCEKQLTEEDRVRRGLCDTCYQGMKNAVNKQRVTERELMRDGKLLAPKPGGRKPANAFTASLQG